MRDDFAVFILTHGRAKEQKTLKTLLNTGYTGKYYLVVDNLDKQQEEYSRIYGEHVIVFDKLNAYEITDTFHNEKILKAVVFPRNMIFEMARQRGIQYFAMCDDDISRIEYKNENDGKMRTTKVTKNINRILEAYVHFSETSKLTVLGFCESGVFIGGVNQIVKNGYTPSIGKFMIFRTQDEVKYRGLYYEDNIASLDIPLQGRISLSPTMISITSQVDVKKSARGGMHETYDKTAECYVCSFMVLMAHPSGVKIKRDKGKWKIRKSMNNLRPKLINERYRKM